jgi:hypothetical protein
MRAALAIGGAGALSTAVGLYGLSDAAAARDPEDGVTAAERANRQHSWNAYERQAHGTFLPPEHHLLLFLDYEDNGAPSADHREEAREAFDRLEEAFEWSHEGLLFTIGYSYSYFERFEEDPPRGIQPGNGAIPRMFTGQEIIEGPKIPILDFETGKPKRLLDLNVTLPREDPVADDGFDACLHLASDHVQNLLAAETALWGFPEQERTEVGGVDFSGANLDGIFRKPTEYPERRTGFAGNENLDENVDKYANFGPGDEGHGEFRESVDQGAELSMGYNDLYKNSMPREDNVTMLEDHRFLPGPPNWQPPGVFANGSIMHVSHLESDLEGWYGENDDTERRHRMFSPHHDKEDVGNVGENLGNSNAPDDTKDYPMRDFTNPTYDVAERTEEDFNEGHNIGHAQKTARARAQLEAHFRNEDGGPPLDIPLRDDPVAQERDDALPNTDGNQDVETGFLRRDFNTVDTGQAGTHFVVLQAFSIYVVYVRHAMNSVDFNTGAIGQPPTPDDTLGFEHEADDDDADRVANPKDGEDPEHGILEYVTTLRRGNFIVPPIHQRALPHASSIKLVESEIEPETGLGGAPLPPYVGTDGTFEFERDGGRYRITVDESETGDIDRDSVRFGFYRNVNAAGGAPPMRVQDDGNQMTFEFPVGATRLPDELEREANDSETPDDDTVRARLYAERKSDRKPIFATTTVSGSGSE